MRSWLWRSHLASLFVQDPLARVNFNWWWRWVLGEPCCLVFGLECVCELFLEGARQALEVVGLDAARRVPTTSETIVVILVFL